MSVGSRLLAASPRATGPLAARTAGAASFTTTTTGSCTRSPLPMSTARRTGVTLGTSVRASSLGPATLRSASLGATGGAACAGCVRGAAGGGFGIAAGCDRAPFTGRTVGRGSPLAGSSRTTAFAPTRGAISLGVTRRTTSVIGPVTVCRAVPDGTTDADSLGEVVVRFAQLVDERQFFFRENRGFGELFQDRNRLAGQSFNALEHRAFGGIAEGDRFAGRPGPARPADAMDVGLGFVGEIEVEDMGDVVDIDAAGGEVGRQQHPQLADAEAVERPLPGVLALVAMNRLSPDAITQQLPRDAVGTMLGAGEDNRAVNAGLPQEGREQAGLLRLRDMHDRLIDEIGRASCRERV